MSLWGCAAKVVKVPVNAAYTVPLEEHTFDPKTDTPRTAAKKLNKCIANEKEANSRFEKIRNTK